jgi:hypothetical protein
MSEPESEKEIYRPKDKKIVQTPQILDEVKTYIPYIFLPSAAHSGTPTLYVWSEE